MAQGALLLPRSYKPQQFARVNSAHPMARKLMAFFYHAGSATTGPVLWDAVKGIPGLGVANITYKATSEGGALACAAPARVSYTGIRNQNASQSDRCTVIARMRLTTAPASTCYPVCLTGNTTSSRGVAVGFTSAGFVAGAESGTNGMIPGVGTVNRLNQWVTVGASANTTTALDRVAPQVAGRVWENGARGATTTVSGSTSATITLDRINVGRDGTGYFGTFTGDIAWFAAFNNLLTDEEHAWWHRNAFEVLEQTRNYSFFAFPEVAGGATFTPQSNRAILQAVNRASTF